MDRPGVSQVPEGSAEQRKMEETGCEVICGAPKTPRFATATTDKYRDTILYKNTLYYDCILHQYYY